MAVQVPNGVVDIAVKDEAGGRRRRQQYLSYFQGRRIRGRRPMRASCRFVGTENRLRYYDMRAVITVSPISAPCWRSARTGGPASSPPWSAWKVFRWV